MLGMIQLEMKQISERLQIGCVDRCVTTSRDRDGEIDSGRGFKS